MAGQDEVFRDATSNTELAHAHETVEASWWADVSLSTDVADFEPAEVLHDSLRTLAAAAAEEFGDESLRARTLTAMARATSAMLDLDSRNDPFAPATQRSGRRSVIPSDLEDDELGLLADALPLVESVVLKARFADVVWTYRFPRDPALAAAATEAYMAVPLTWNTWARTGRDSYRRAVQLARRQGKPGTAVLERLTARLIEFICSGGGQAGFLAQVSEVLRSTGQVTAGQFHDFGGRLSDHATHSPGGTPSERALLREAGAWYHRAGEDEEALACQVRIADSYAKEAEQRMGGDRGALLASGPMEQSLEVLRELPRKYRESHGLEQVLATRQARLRELRQHSLEEMTTVRSSEPDDVYEWVERARRHVAGRERFRALVALTGVAPLIDLEEQTEAAREYLTDGFTRLLSRTTLSSDGRKVGASAGDVAATPTDAEILEELVRRNAHRMGLVVQALIMPAAETVTDEHRFDLAFVEAVCRESPIVPMRHAGLWARGIWQGLNGDFPSAVSILVPQVEQMVRLHLKNEGVHTLFIGDGGVETEKALGALLDMEQALVFLGPNLTFELRALLLDQTGPNLRNELAHGLVTDGTLWGAPGIYAWWLCLRMALTPFATKEDPGEEVPDGPVEDPTEDTDADEEGSGARGEPSPRK